ncbi:chorismate mutase aro7 [Apophysomyces sp. BC1034]|nr:chorismate mutase aro7 [Apophysomyces sp. BC1015]KAG0167991.1 chorismate mutase aro7 [Apophysomyces sp. BC1021]KAG0183995.1 chorismate mutase aro7 [Apophysomyces sp. BC1034]
MSNFTADDSFSLDKLRSTLVRLEDTIIFALIERAQFASNKCIYSSGSLQFQGATGERSFLEYFLWETEKVHAKVRRYTSPDEYAFTSPLPEPILPSIDYRQFLFPNDININDDIMKMYINSIVPFICQEGDDNNYGSSATKDIECLQALSRRIHYGKFIAESKFRSSPEEYTCLAQANDREGIYELLTNRDVEKKLLDRLRRKALVYGQTFDQEKEGTSAHLRIPVQAVVDLYEKWVIPLTKEVEVQYLIRRGTTA